MRRVFILLICAFMTGPLHAQDNPTYGGLTSQALQLFLGKDFEGAARNYSQAFELYGDRSQASDRYNAALVMVLAGRTDDAFEQLFHLAEKMGYAKHENLENEQVFGLLRADSRWQQLTEIVRANRQAAEAKLDKELASTLERVFEEDQNYRKQIDSIQKMYGANSPEVVDHWMLINAKDSVNTVIVTQILDERGWLGPDVVGDKGSSALFLVIQHADIKVQEKYLPMMREAVIRGDAKPNNLALLEDRVALRQGRMQIYGSQVSQIAATGEMYVMPLADPDNVNKRRDEVGLQPLESYLAIFGLGWDPEQYKKELPRYKKMHNIKE